jgi:hypothetical protein
VTQLDGWVDRAPTFSRPGVSDDNPCIESLNRTIKYRPEYPSQPFTSLRAAEEWLCWFATWHKDKHRHSAIGFVTPRQRHCGDERRILPNSLLKNGSVAEGPAPCSISRSENGVESADSTQFERRRDRARDRGRRQDAFFKRLLCGRPSTRPRDSGVRSGGRVRTGP